MSCTQTVILNVYDVVDHPYHSSVGNMLSLGIHHTGVQVGSREYAFTLEGIVVTRPKKLIANNCRLTKSVVQGEASEEVVQHVLTSRLQHEYTPSTYDPLSKNCNHFSTAFVEAITGTKVPPWVNRAPRVAGMLGTSVNVDPTKATAPPVSWSLLLPFIRGDQEDEEEIQESKVAASTFSSSSEGQRHHLETMRLRRVATEGVPLVRRRRFSPRECATTSILKGLPSIEREPGTASPPSSPGRKRSSSSYTELDFLSFDDDSSTEDPRRSSKEIEAATRTFLMATTDETVN